MKIETKNNMNKENNEPTLSDEKLAKFLSGMTNDIEEEEVMQYIEKHPETLTSMQNVVYKGGQKIQNKKENLTYLFQSGCLGSCSSRIGAVS